MPRKDKLKGREYNAKWRAANPEKCRAYSRKWYALRPDRQQTAHLRRKYNLTIQQRQSLLDTQGGKCASCGGTLFGGQQTHIDHNHQTGQVRGILCHGCNTALGLLGESVERIYALASYVQRWK